jgi:hypothetical protein
MAISGSAVYLSTMLLEKNRWNGKGPSLLVSDWMEPIGEAGFAGLDIWMNHLRFSSRSEWELIKDMAADSDLALALISATVPTDNSDKSQRLRESILEACDYFRPDGLKLSLAEDARLRGPVAVPVESLEFIRTWGQDVPREIGLLFDAGEGPSSLDALALARKTLSGDRYKAVLHPFLLPPRRFEAALEASGDFIANLGVQAKKDGEWILIEDEPDAHFQVLAAARTHGFKGTWSLEYTKGIGLPGEDIDDLFDNAEKDLNFMIESMARNSSTRKAKGKG